MLENVHIHQATPHDLVRLLPLHRSLYLTHRQATLSDDSLLVTQYRDFERVLEGDLRSLLGREDAVVLWAEFDGEAIGYISGTITNDDRRLLPTRGFVEDWFVSDNRRIHGLGRTLMEALCRTLALRGCQIVESSTWVENEVARRAHEALGFTESRVRFRRLLSESS